MNMQKWIDAVRNEKKKRAMPILSFPCINLLGVTVRELTTLGELQAEGIKAIARRYPSLAAVGMMDLSVEAEAFGASVRFSDDEVPTVTGRTVCTLLDAQKLGVPDPNKDGRCAEYLEAIKLAKQDVVDRPVFAGVTGPYSLAGRLMGVSEIMMACYDEPEMVTLVLNKATEFLIEYVKEYKRLGADGIIMAEPLAGMLSPALAEEFSKPYVKKIVDEVQDETFLVIYHNCGNNVLRMLDSIVSTGAAVYHFGNAIDMKEALAAIPSDRLVMGNVDPVATIRQGNPSSIRAKVKQVMRDCSGYNNFVLSSGCDIPLDSPIENVDAFFEAVKEYYDEEV